MSLKMDGIYVKVMKINRQSWAKYSSIKVSLSYVSQVQSILHHVIDNQVSLLQRQIC